MLGLAALYRMVSVVVSFAERRSNFVAAVSHELKTPLTAIRMYGEMLRDGMVPSEAKRDEYYRHITAESERLSRLINNVLEFARLEKGTREVALATGAVAPVVREVAELVRPHVEGQGFALGVDDRRRDLPPVRFERDALMQVLCNLVDNAVKYARDASPKRDRAALLARRRRRARRRPRSRPRACAARHLGKIFEPFYRGENELTRRSKGTGLGLALVRGLVERMGARVQRPQRRRRRLRGGHRISPAAVMPYPGVAMRARIVDAGRGVALISLLFAACGSDALRSRTATPSMTALPTATPTVAAPTPTPTPAALCAARTGGALIRFAVCDETLSLWSTADPFIDEAIALLASGEQRIPVFSDLVDGMDCDRKWTWHADPAAMSFADFAIELCDGCPFHIEDDKPYWLDTVGQYCPWAARVIAVDDRRTAS